MKAFALLIIVASALAAPAQNKGCGNAAAGGATGGAAGAGTGAATGGAGAGGAGAATGGATGGAAAAGSCAKAKADLQNGIQANLNIQAQELAGIQTLQKQLGTADFKATQARVLAIQQSGIDIRANNQKLAKQINSPASAGLDIVQGAQVKEKSQVQGLTGTAATDTATLNTLVQEVQDGTKQNQKNLADAKSTKC